MPSLNQLLARIADMFAFGTSIGIPLANRNMIVDGAFDHWTNTGATAIPGTGQAISGATMYYGSAGTSGAANHYQAPQRTYSGVMANTETCPSNALAHNQTTASTGTITYGPGGAVTLPYISQKLESVHKTAGKSITFSVKLWTDTPFIMVGVFFNQSFGSGGSPTAGVNTTKQINWSISNSPRKFSVRIDVPALPSGVVYGTNSNDWLHIGFALPAGWTGNVYMTEWQVELCSSRSSSDINGNGGAPTAFEYRGQQAEIARVQRYYEMCSSLNMVSNGSTSFGGAWMPAFFHVAKRAVPAVAAVVNNGSGITISGIGVGGDTNSVNASYLATQPLGTWNNLTFTADARL